MHLGQSAIRSLALLAILPLAACDNDEPTAPPTLYVSSSNTGAVRTEIGAPSTVILNVSRPGSGPVTLNVEGMPAGMTASIGSPTLGAGVDTTSLTFEVSSAVAPGNYVLYVNATSGGLTDRHRVTVFVPTPGITIIPGWTWFELGDAGRQAGIARVALPNSNVTWQSANPAIATVSATGVITPVAVGSTVVRAISAVDSRFRDSITVNVRANPAQTWTLLQSGVAMTGLSGGDRLWRIVVPRGATRLTITTAGGTGDQDIYVWRNQSPGAYTTASLACFSFNDGNSESCIINNPADGIYYISQEEWDAWSGVTLTATVAMP
jgi:hypothetical protein